MSKTNPPAADPRQNSGQIGQLANNQEAARLNNGVNIDADSIHETQTDEANTEAADCPHGGDQA